MINPIERSSAKLVHFTENKFHQIARDAHPYRPEIRERKKPRPRQKFSPQFAGDIMQSRFLF